MRTHPILFSTPMVQAILAGNKTMTRRTKDLDFINATPDEWNLQRIESIEHRHKMPETGSKIGATFISSENKEAWIKSPYGNIGDVLWVRETFQILPSNMVFYKADPENKVTGNWKPAIHMPKQACRIWLEITNVRVERLNAITEADAIAEGISKCKLLGCSHLFENYGGFMGFIDANQSFKSLWTSIHGIDSWDKNPWLWVIEFKQIEKPQNF